MLRRFVRLTTRLGQATAFVLGLLVLGALLAGPVSFGLAAVGDPLKLGRGNNAANKVTSLVATLAGPVLRLTNQGTGPAVELKVQSGQPPLKVPADAGTALNLDADRLDGFDAEQVVRTRIGTYEVTQNLTAPGTSDAVLNLFCDDGDLMQAGGYLNPSANGAITHDAPSSGSAGWRIVLRSTNASDATVTGRLRCFDFPPLR